MTQKLLSDEELRNAIAKAAGFSRSSGWYFDKVGEKLNATSKVLALEELINTQKRLYGDMRVEEERSSRREEDDKREAWEDGEDK